MRTTQTGRVVYQAQNPEPRPELSRVGFLLEGVNSTVMSPNGQPDPAWLSYATRSLVSVVEPWTALP
jgi:hypothetical protein